MSTVNSSDLERAESMRGVARVFAYLRLSGPAWVQSAITLGGGTLAGALYLGIIGGYSMLWVQPLAVALGVVLLGAIAYVTLSIERSPFEAIRSEINPALAWLWLIASVVACAVWTIPQFALSYAVLSQNLIPGAISNPDGNVTRLVVTALLFVVIGGLTVSETRTDRNRLPLLLDIPIIGGLFRVTRESTIPRDLIILVTPTIVRGGQN